MTTKQLHQLYALLEQFLSDHPLDDAYIGETVLLAISALIAEQE